MPYFAFAFEWGSPRKSLCQMTLTSNWSWPDLLGDRLDLKRNIQFSVLMRTYAPLMCTPSNEHVRDIRGGIYQCIICMVNISSRSVPQHQMLDLSHVHLGVENTYICIYIKQWSGCNGKVSKLWTMAQTELWLICMRMKICQYQWGLKQWGNMSWFVLETSPL